jgi:23S rRNA (uracil1939-C5)-methyltransferase
VAAASARDPEADTRTWLVRGGLPGELVEVALDREARRSLHGHVMRVLEPADARVDPPCSLAGECGGCGWQHVEPKAQAEYKRQVVADQMRDLLQDGSLTIPPTVTAGPALGYRRRVRMYYERDGDRLTLGFRRARAHELVDVPACPVLEPALDRAVQGVRALARHLPGSGNLLGISDGARAVLGLPGVRPEPALERALEQALDDVLVGVAVRGGRRRATIGRERLDVDGGKGLVAVPCGPFDFCQVQTAMNAKLVEHVAAAARPHGQRVLELHAGSGNLTRRLALEAKRVWTIEQTRETAKILRDLADRHGLAIKARHGAAEGALSRLAAANERYDVVVLDPPRRGLGEAASQDLTRVASTRIVYVSCDPATLARDVRVLVKGGFRLEDLRVFDMMPMTSEAEVVATLVGSGGTPS